MRQGISKILITGGAGFIGSAFVRLICRDGFPEGQSLRYRIIVVDNLTYAGDLARLTTVKGKYKFYKTDISNPTKIESIFRRERPEVVINFAAETHVDRSIQDASVFLKTNCIGVQILLDQSREYKVKKFIQISTDEVYGDINRGKFKEASPLKPNSPYAASKAAADLLIRAYIRTYNFPAVIIRPSNNYGPWQYPEKLIPLAVLKILRKEKIPVYARGKNVREWLFVEDCAEGVLKILQRGRLGQIYNLGSQRQMQNLKVVKLLLNFFGKDTKMIDFVKDRPGHDFRYSLDSSKVFQGVGWRPKRDFAAGLKLTVKWCLGHKEWLLSKWGNISPLYKQ